MPNGLPQGREWIDAEFLLVFLCGGNSSFEDFAILGMKDGFPFADGPRPAAGGVDADRAKPGHNRQFPPAGALAGRDEPFPAGNL